MYGNYGNEGSYDRRSFAPVKEGEEVDVEIESVGEKGDGIAKVKGFVIFVPGTKAGERVKIKISKVLRKVGFGEVIGEAAPAPEGEDQAEGEAPMEEAPKKEEKKPAEDTEDFGGEDSEDF